MVSRQLSNLIEKTAGPLKAFNIIASVGAFIWLASLAEWEAVGYGIILIVSASIATHIVVLPSGLILMASHKELKKQHKTIAVSLSVLSSIVNFIIIGVWCVWIMGVFYGNSTDSSLIPILFWSYTIALTPLFYMDYVNNKSNFFDLMNVFFTQIAYIFGIIVLVVTENPISTISIVIFVLIIGVIFETLTSRENINNEIINLNNETSMDIKKDEKEDIQDNFFEYIKNLEEIQATEEFSKEEQAAKILAIVTFFQYRGSLMEDLYKIEGFGVKLDNLTGEKEVIFFKEMLIVSMFLITYMSRNLGISDNVIDIMNLHVYKYMVEKKEIINNDEILQFQETLHNRYVTFYKAMEIDEKNDTFLFNLSETILKNIFNEQELSFEETMEFHSVLVASLATWTKVIDEGVKQNIFKM